METQAVSESIASMIAAASAAVDAARAEAGKPTVTQELEALRLNLRRDIPPPRRVEVVENGDVREYIRGMLLPVSVTVRGDGRCGEYRTRPLDRTSTGKTAYSTCAPRMPFLENLPHSGKWATFKGRFLTAAKTDGKIFERTEQGLARAIATENVVSFCRYLVLRQEFGLPVLETFNPAEYRYLHLSEASKSAIRAFRGRKAITDLKTSLIREKEKDAYSGRRAKKKAVIDAQEKEEARIKTLIKQETQGFSQFLRKLKKMGILVGRVVRSVKMRQRNQTAKFLGVRPNRAQVEALEEKGRIIRPLSPPHTAKKKEVIIRGYYLDYSVIYAIADI